MKINNKRRKLLIAAIGLGGVGLVSQYEFIAGIAGSQLHRLTGKNAGLGEIKFSEEIVVSLKEQLIDRGLAHEFEEKALMESLNKNDSRAVQRILQDQIREDFQSERIVSLNGWQISATEARLVVNLNSTH
jgi:hypothetical protein